MTELFKDFKKLNGDSDDFVKSIVSSRSGLSNPVPSSGTNDNADDSAGNDSFEVVKSYQTGSKLTALYVGDLDKDVTEEKLYKFFDKFKSLSSVKICYHPQTKLSLGYGYVNFDSQEEANRAIEELNYTTLLSKEVRIMPSMKGKDKPFLGTNVFISNLNTIKISTLRSFYETFKKYGTILSCKIDFKKRQGFISFKDKTTAEKFVDECNETTLYGYRIYCSIHIPKSIRTNKTDQTKSSIPSSSASTLKEPLHSPVAMPGNPNSRTFSNSAKVSETSQKTIPTDYSFTRSLVRTLTPTSESAEYHQQQPQESFGFKQLYLKGLPVDATAADVRTILSGCGEIVEIFIENVPKYRSSWAMVTLKNNQDGPKAVGKLHRSSYKKHKITCVRALKKADRQRQLKIEKNSTCIISPAKNLDDHPKTYKLHLYNLPPGTSENFFKLFLKSYNFEGSILKFYITLTSSKENTSYIEFSNRDDAKSVLAKLNGVEISGFTVKATLTELSEEDIELLVKKPEPTSTATATNSQTIPVPSEPSIKRSRSTTELHPAFYMSPMNHQPQVVQGFGGGIFHLVPVGRPARGRINSDLPPTSIVRSASLREPRETVESLEYWTSNLEKILPRYVDFLKYPVATRPRNIKRVVQYLADHFWHNDLACIKRDLARLQAHEPVLEDLLKQKLADTIEYFGLDR
jgi:RNA recognition motif-containing protein